MTGEVGSRGPGRPEPGTFEAMAVTAIQKALDDDHDSVAWAVLDAGDGGAFGRTFTGREIVKTRVRFSGPHGEHIEEVLPLFGIGDLVAEGVEIHELGAPLSDFIFWQAIAGHETTDGRLLIARVRDYRGQTAALLSTARRRNGRAFGEHVTQLLLRSSVQGRRGRVRAAAERIGEDPRRPGLDLRAIAAGALTEYYAKKATVDGAHPVVEWSVVELDLASGNVMTLSSSKPGGERSRWGHLNQFLVKALEDETFGREIHSPRGKYEFDQLLDDVSDRGSAEAFAKLEIDELIGRAPLTERERDVFLLYRLGFPFADIGERLGISEATARATKHHALQKLREAAGS